MKFGNDTRGLLAETAFLAVVTGQTPAARCILAGLGDSGIDVKIGKALIEMTEGRPDTAAALLAADAEAGDGYAGVFRALALRLAGKTAECEAALVGLEGSEPAVDQLAAALRTA